MLQRQSGDTKMKTTHMNLRTMQRGIGEDIISLIERYGEFNARGDRIILTRKMIRKLLRKA
jgi:hypothetical protein